MPIAEAQSKWVADYLRGVYALPASAPLAWPGSLRARCA